MSVLMASNSPYNDVQPIRTGTLLDKVTGIGGIPRKRITELFGDAGVGKSSVVLQSVAQAQEQGMRCLWADVEFSYDSRYAEALGVTNNTLGLIQERFAEDTLDVIEKEIDSGNWDLVVLDSIGGLLPRQEAEKGNGEKTIGGQAGLIARFCRKVVPLLALRNVALVVINHSFTDIMSGKIKTSGGAKLDYHKSISIRLKQKSGVVLKQGEKRIGKVIIGEVKKNKLAATEGLEVEAQMIFGEGFSQAADLLQDALDKGILRKEGNNFFFGEEKVAYGMPKMRELMKDSDFAEKVKLALETA